eukprot:gene23067-30257_t
MVHSKYILNSDISDAALRALLHSTDHGSADSTDNTDTRYPATWYSSEEGTSDKDSSDQVWVVAHGSLMAASVILMVPVVDAQLVATAVMLAGFIIPFQTFIPWTRLVATVVVLTGFIIPVQTFVPWSCVNGELVATAVMPGDFIIPFQTFMLWTRLLATAVMLAGFIIPFQTFMPWSHVSGEATIVKAHVGIGITVFSLFGFHARE